MGRKLSENLLFIEVPLLKSVSNWWDGFVAQELQQQEDSSQEAVRISLTNAMIYCFQCVRVLLTLVPWISYIKH